MKKTKIIAIAVLLLFFVMAESVFASKKENSGLSLNQKALLYTLIEEADNRVKNAKKHSEPEALISESSQKMVFPAKYDLRAVDTDGDGKTENYVTSVKQQSPFGTCWAFASIAAAETSILFDKKQQAVEILPDGSERDSINLSEHHLGWFAYTPIPHPMNQAGEGLYSQVKNSDKISSLRLSSGSTQFAASSVFASGMGPVLEPDYESSTWPESALNYHGKDKKLIDKDVMHRVYYSADDDWSVDESLRFKQSYMLEDVYYLPSPVRFDENNEYDYYYAERVIKAYKEQLVNGRAVSISFFADTYHPDKINTAPRYINTATDSWAHFCYEPVMANHAVTVVGWDDDFPASKFLTEVQERDSEGKLVFNEDESPKMKSVEQPAKNGAWIVKNSWGSKDSIADGLNISTWGIDGSGYFYLSYWDQSMTSSQCFDFDINNDLKENLGQYVLEEYDFMPVENPHSVTTDFEVATANVFTAEENMRIKAVSCTTTKANEKLTIELYVLPEGKTLSSKNLKLVSKDEKVFSSAGLHVVRLPKAYNVKKDQKFVVCITQETDNGYLFSVGCEYNKKGFDAGFCEDNYAAKGVVNPGESYVYLSAENKWWDFSEVKDILEHMVGSTSYFTYDNFPIKAYASITK